MYAPPQVRIRLEASPQNRAHRPHKRRLRRDPALLGVPGAGDRGAPKEAASPAGPSGRQPHAPGSASLLLWIKGKLFTWNILKTIALGQMLSLCICGTAITSQYLAERYKVNTPMLQSFINYCLLFLIYTVMLAFQSGSDNFLYILKKKWWKYILLRLVDVEANYLIVRAYQYPTLTSVQVAQCCLYSFMPLVIKVTSATSVNLGILTADLYSLFFGLFLFGYTFSGLYILSFTVIMVGFILYCSTPTRTAEPAESSVPPVTSTGIDNLGLKLEENLQETHSAVL
ncbi:TPA: hypothetical protein BOS_23916 [Bos taurus]|nr:TPA: hypothetical protein BOS_23916 [Bos taurus]